MHDPTCAGRGIWFTEHGDRTEVHVCKGCAVERKWREHIAYVGCLILGVAVLIGLMVLDV
jgi:hypothetical protein